MAEQRGALRQHYREGQEDQLGALVLVVNAIVLWNTRHIDAPLRHLRKTGVDVSPDDVVRLYKPALTCQVPSARTVTGCGPRTIHTVARAAISPATAKPAGRERESPPGLQTRRDRGILPKEVRVANLRR